MSQSGYTPIQLYYSTTASNTPSTSNLKLGELAFNIADNKIYALNTASNAIQTVVGTLGNQNKTAVSITGGAIDGTTIGGTTAAAITGTTITASTQFDGPGTGLTGTASSLSIGGAAPAGSLSGTTLNSTVVSSSLTSVGTLTTGTWNATKIGVAYGGTGLTSLTSNYIPYGNGTSALNSSSAFTYNGTALTVGQIISPTIGAASSTALSLQSNGTTNATLNSSGFFGIGQTSPICYLDIYGSGAYTYARFYRSDEAGYGGRVGTGNTLFGSAATRSLGLDGYAGISFGIAGSQAGTFDSNGYLLVGYTSSNGSYKLQVNSQIFATSSTIATSDANYKTNVTPLTGALALVNTLNPVSFNWKQHKVHDFDTTNVQVGFLAQEVQTAMASQPYVNSIVKKSTVTLTPAVTDNQGNITTPAVTEDFLGIAEGNMVSVLTKAIQELSTQVTALQAQVTALTPKA